MAFVARRPLRLTGLDGVMYTVQPGEQVPGFETWSYPVRQAHLDQESVINTAPEGRVLSTVGGRLHLAAAATDPVAIDEALPKDVMDAVLDNADAQLLPCPHCDHEGFSSKNSLIKHVKRKHQEA